MSLDMQNIAQKRKTLEHLFLKLMGNLIAILFVSYGFQGIQVNRFRDALLGAIILGIINISIKPMIILVTLPFNIISLGVFTLVINAFMLKFVAWFIPGFIVTGFLTAFFGALTISVISIIITFISMGFKRDEMRGW
jgi:putative membrane protein